MRKSSKDIINQVLLTLAPYIEEMTKKQVQWLEKESKKPATKFDEECIKRGLVFDVVRALDSYTLKSDSIVDKIEAGMSQKGNIEISTTIKRAGEKHYFSTEAIVAGGYNIQCLHYRYIVRTKLPRIGGVEDTLKMKKEIAKFKKIGNLKNNIAKWKNRISELKSLGSENKKLSNEEIWIKVLEKREYPWPTWKTIIENGATENYESEEAFNWSQENYKNDLIHDWKYINIERKGHLIDSFKRYIEQEKKAIERAKNK